ncbi:MAG: hypothetical protein IPN71_01705 [Fibrobacteres bacterium]|nr:hypothetical protein [Fibrobacterota bacterium]
MAAVCIVLGLTACERKAGEQNARIDAIELGEAKKVRFPVVRTGDAKTSDKINQDLKVRIFGDESANLTTDSALKRWVSDFSGEVDFEVTYLEKGIASLNLNKCGCGSFCTCETSYFTYNTNTGEHLGVGQIVDTVGEFRSRVLADRKSLYRKGRMAFMQQLKDNESGATTDDVEWAKREYDVCAGSEDMASLALYADSLVIADRCQFPNAIRFAQPGFSLKYRYAEIRQHLRLPSLR